MGMRHALFLALVACSRSPGAATLASASTVSSASAPVADAAPVKDLAETDYQGAFNGAKLYATFAASNGVVSGSLFYPAVGADISLEGTLDGGLTLREVGKSGAVSTTTLAKDASGAFVGTWTSTAGKSGPAKLDPIARKAGEPALVVDRSVADKSDALCNRSGKSTPKPTAPCNRVGNAPVVLGLTDRAFQEKLDKRLLDAAKMTPPDNSVGLGVKVSWMATLNARGVLSIELNGAFVNEEACSRGPRDCTGLDAFAPGHNYRTTTSVVAALDAGVIGTPGRHHRSPKGAWSDRADDTAGLLDVRHERARRGSWAWR
jgi:hypothetical protein